MTLLNKGTVAPYVAMTSGTQGSIVSGRPGSTTQSVFGTFSGYEFAVVSAYDMYSLASLDYVVDFGYAYKASREGMSGVAEKASRSLA